MRKKHLIPVEPVSNTPSLHDTCALFTVRIFLVFLLTCLSLGGDVKGGRVYGKWPGLTEHQLNEGRELALTTDFRSVVGEILTKHLGGVKDMAAVFPGFANDPRNFPELMRS